MFNYQPSKVGGRAIVMKHNHSIIVTGTVEGDVDLTIAGTPLVELHRPFFSTPDPDDTAVLLSWKSLIPRTLYGRDTEMAKLLHWAESDYPLKARLIYGESGVGKTRLAFELATRLAEQPGWLTGRVKAPDDLVAYPLGDKGTLLIIDFPEERNKAIRTFMQRLGGMKELQGIKLRILLLARRKEANMLLDDLMDRSDEPLCISRFTGDQDQQAWRLFNDAWVTIQACKKRDTTTPPLDEHAFLDWLTSHRLHRRPLFIVAFALHLSEQPEATRLRGPAIIRTLADREVLRLRKEIDALNRIHSEAGEPHIQPEAIMLVKALTGITGQLDRPAIEALHAIELDGIQPPPFRSIVETSIWRDGSLPMLEPDLLAAQLLESVLNKEKMSPGPWLYHCLKLHRGEALRESLIRLGRLRYDYRHDLSESEGSETQGMDPLIGKLSETLKHDPAFCRELAHALLRHDLERSLLPLAITVYRTLLKDTKDAETCAGYWNNLSVHLSASGNRTGGLDAIRQAVEIREKLAEENFAVCGPALADSLNNLSVELAESGDPAGGLDAIQRAVAIHEKLAKENFSTYGPALAMSLNKLSNRLIESGDRAVGLDAGQRAVAIHQTLTKENFSIYGPALARSLNNLSNRLAESGDHAGGLDASRRAVAIHEKLAAENFSTYGPALAKSLNNLSVHLAKSGDRADGLDASLWAVEIHEKLAENDFAAYGPDLARSLNNLSNRLAESGDLSGGLNAIRRAVEIREKLAEENFAAYGPDLALSLNNLSLRLVESGDRAGGLDASLWAVEIDEILAKEDFATYSPALATSLNNLSLRLSESGDRTDGLDAIRRAVDIREKLAEENFTAWGPDLASSLNNLSHTLVESGDLAGGLDASLRAVEIDEILVEEDFSTHGPALAMSLNNLSNRLSESGDRADGLDAIRRAVNIYKTLAKTNLAYMPDLALSLNNLSNHLTENGDRAGGLDAIRQAVPIYEALAKENIAAYGPNLARSLNILSNRLAESGDQDGGLDAIRRAVAIIEPFAKPGTVYAEWFEGMKRDLFLREPGEK